VARRRTEAAPEEIGPKGALNEARWSSVVDAAFAVFTEKGYQAATVQDVAARVGLLKGSLYYYIQSKEDLLFAIVQRAYLRAKDSVDHDDGLTTGSAAQRLRHFIHLWTANIDSQSDALRLAERETRYLTKEHRQELRTHARQIEAVLGAIIEDGRAGGEFDPGVDRRLAVVTIFRLLNNHGSRQVPAAMGRRIRDWNEQFILRGLGAGASQGGPPG
jgi:AcrR family transcriptional regulator